MDLSKAFDCVPHDLIIAKLSAYGFEHTALEFLLSYLTNRKQATRLNGLYSLFELIVAGVPQGSILGPIIFNMFINDLFYFMKSSTLHNYADDNTISACSNSISNLIRTLESESSVALSWLSNNKMIANPEKFHAIILTRNKTENVNLKIRIGDRIIQSEKWVKLLGVKIDNKLKCEEHIRDLCKKASGQMNALFRFQNFLSHKAKAILVQSFINANFNYCPLVWHFSNAKSLLKLESIYRRSQRFLYEGIADSTLYEDRLSTMYKHHMTVNRLRSLCIEIFKTINNLNPSFMRNIFTPRDSNRPVRNSTIN